MAKRLCYPISTVNSSSTHQETAFLVDSLYCLEKHWEQENIETEKDSYVFRGIDVVRINSPNSVILSEQGFLWEDEELVSLLVKERKNMLHTTLQNNQTLAAARRTAVEWILKVNAHYSFTALTAVLAVDYVDRFLSSIHCQIEKPWMIHLTAVACISIAAKVEETHVPLLLDLQVVDNEYFFEARTIKRMEILILSTLEWRMNPVNPLSFLDYVVRRLGFKYQLRSDFLGTCERLLLSVISDSRFVSFLPSVIASAIMLRGIDDTEPCVAAKYQNQLLGFLQMDKDKVNACSRFLLEALRGHRNGCNKRRFGPIPNSSSKRWMEGGRVLTGAEPVTKKSKVEEHPVQIFNFTA